MCVSLGERYKRDSQYALPEELSNVNEHINSSWGNNLLLKIVASRTVTKIVAEAELGRALIPNAQGNEPVTNRLKTYIFECAN